MIEITVSSKMAPEPMAPVNEDLLPARWSEAQPPQAAALSGSKLFLREFFRSSAATGSLFPTSRFAANVIAARLDTRRSTPLRILEVGPGTGSITEALLSRMKDSDHLTMCEINPAMAEHLRLRIHADARFKRHASRLAMFTGSVLDMETPRAFDWIVCSLPFLNFEPTFVRDVLAKLQSLAGNEGVVTCYEYLGVRRAAKLWMGPTRRARLIALEGLFHSWQRKLVHTVWKNLPPMGIYEIPLHPRRT